MVLAAAVELLHCATLVHDDVIDDAAARRGVATGIAVEGSSTAILTGDVLIAAAVRAGHHERRVRDELGQATEVCLGAGCDGFGCVGDELCGDGVEFDVLVLGESGDEGEGVVGVDAEAFHHDAFGLADDVPTRQRGAQLVFLLCPGEGDRGVGGEDQADRFGAALGALSFCLMPRWARRLYRLPGLPTTDMGATLALRALRSAAIRVPERHRVGPLVLAARQRVAHQVLTTP